MFTSPIHATRLLYWYLMLCLFMLGSVVMGPTGIYTTVFRADVTLLSFLIFILFWVFTIRTGIQTWQATTTTDTGRAMQLLHQLDLSWFVSDVLVSLGMLGTVIGFLYMLGVNFANLDPSNSVLLKASLKAMSTGMSTALWTTASGLVCSILLKIQLFNVNELLEKQAGLQC